MDYRDIFSDIISHAGDFKKAILIAKQHAEVRDPDIDDKAYWDHQTKVYERIEKVARLLVGDDDFVPVGDTGKEKFESLYDHAASKVAAFQSITGVVGAEFKLRSLNAQEQAALALGNMYYQVCNGGIQQYIENGYSTQTGSRDIPAASFISVFTKSTADADEDVSKAVKACAAAANKHPDLNLYGEGRFEHVVAEFESLETALYVLDEDRVFQYFVDAIQRLEPSRRPFIEGWALKEPTPTFTP